jgi:hypothetical protein
MRLIRHFVTISAGSSRIPLTLGELTVSCGGFVMEFIENNGNPKCPEIQQVFGKAGL